jgi:tRNA A37 N6-isopentenylltransferase MiaA
MRLSNKPKIMATKTKRPVSKGGPRAQIGSNFIALEEMPSEALQAKIRQRLEDMHMHILECQVENEKEEADRNRTTIMILYFVVGMWPTLAALAMGYIIASFFAA